MLATWEFLYFVCLLSNIHGIYLSNFVIRNKISVDVPLNFRGLSWKYTRVNHVSCNFNATHPHMIYGIHSISIRHHCFGLFMLNVMKIFLVHF